MILNYSFVLHLQFNSGSSQNGDSSDSDNDDEEAESFAVSRKTNKQKNNSSLQNSNARPPILGPDPSLPTETGSRRRPKRPRTVFHKALDALQMDWEDSQLKNILKYQPRSRLASSDEKQLSSSPSASSKVNKHGQLLWQEHIPTACARVEALRTHRYTEDALRLSVAIVRKRKHNQVKTNPV